MKPKDRSQATPFSPCDLDGVAPGSVLVAGRVLSVSGDSLKLADALVTLDVHWSSRLPEVRTGQLLELKGTWQPPNRLADVELRAVYPGRLQTAGEFKRFGAQGVARALFARQRAIAACREYFLGQRFLEVQTPVRVAAPGTDVYLEPMNTEQGFLITSPEFHMKRLLSGGLPRIFQLAACTRKGEIGAWHQPEFSMLEWYRAFDSQESVLTDTEALLVAVATAITPDAPPTLTVSGRQFPLNPPFERMTVRQAYRQFARVQDAVELAARDEDKYFELWVEAVEPGLSELPNPVFLTEFPKSQAALAQLNPEDPSVAQRFELCVGGVELCNGYGELTDPEEQRARFQADIQRRQHKGLPFIPQDDKLLHALEEGMPPSGGNALGLDRLVALCLGLQVADTQAFPAQD